MYLMRIFGYTKEKSPKQRSPQGRGTEPDNGCKGRPSKRGEGNTQLYLTCLGYASHSSGTPARLRGTGTGYSVAPTLSGTLCRAVSRDRAIGELRSKWKSSDTLTPAAMSYRARCVMYGSSCREDTLHAVLVLLCHHL